MNSIDEKIENVFDWLNSEPKDTKTKLAQNAVVFGTLLVCVVLSGFAA